MPYSDLDCMSMENDHILRSLATQELLQRGSSRLAILLWTQLRLRGSCLVEVWSLTRLQMDCRRWLELSLV